MIVGYIKEIESRFSVLDELEKAVDLGLQQAESLRQSILKKAFEGRLLSDDQRTALRQDPAYEPAETLLARIRTERKQAVVANSKPRNGKGMSRRKGNKL